MIADTVTTHRLVLDAGHGEYLPEAEGLRVAVLFDPAEVPYVDDGYALEALRATPGVPDGFETVGPTWCVAVEVSGSEEALVAGWEALYEDVSGEPHGDDDVRDYWPSGARLLLAYADDLDRLAGDLPTIPRLADPRDLRKRATLLLRGMIDGRGDAAYAEEADAAVFGPRCRACDGAGEIGWNPSRSVPPDPQLADSATCPRCGGSGVEPR
jgi:hypothetical protein